MKKQAKYGVVLFSLIMLFSLSIFNNALGSFVLDNGSLSGSGGSGWALPDPQGLPEASISEIIRGVLIWLLSIIGIIAIIGFAVSGIMYLISAGNEKMTEKAKSAMMASIIGVIVALSGYIIIQSIDAVLNGYHSLI